MNGLTIEASIEKAILLKVHGLNDDAKRELINLIFHEDSERKDKSRAYYLLGAIANDTTLQSCRFQIGQAYFGDGVMFFSQNTLLSDKNRARNSLEQAKKWFDEVIVNSGERDTFYLQISEERNRHISEEKN